MSKPITILGALTLALAACASSPAADTAPPAATDATAADTAVKPIPDGYHTVTPTLVVQGVDAAVDFYVKALAAKERFRFKGPDGTTVHAEIQIGDSVIMLGAEEPEHQSKSPATLGGTPTTLHLYVPDVDAAFKTAVDAGATVDMPVADMFWGDRHGSFKDPFGHRWGLATHIEDLTDEQMKQRGEIMAKEMAAAAKKKGKKKKKAKKGAAPAEPAWKKVAGAPAKEKVPAQYNSVTIALTTADANAALAYYKAAFGAEELARMPMEDGRLMHAEIKIGDSLIMLSDAFPEWGGKSPQDLGGSPLSLYVYTEDADKAFATAVQAEGKPVMPVADMFWGDRMGAVLDASGYVWGVATHKENLTPEQMLEKMKAQAAAQPAPAPAPESAPAPAPEAAPAPKK